MGVRAYLDWNATAPLRPQARALARTLYDRWRAAGAIAAVRVNPLATCGAEDLAAGYGRAAGDAQRAVADRRIGGGGEHDRSEG